MSDQPVNFKDTLNLPSTDFPIRPTATTDDLRLLERWQQEKLYSSAMQAHEGKEKFILHDGPPYANGHIHLGHAYNKILKDIITKAYRMMGYHVPIIPGWDCHGLPIEHKVSEQNPGATPQEITRKCRAYAQEWVDVQREEFKKLGVVMDWDNPYITMAPDYEAKIVEAFALLVKNNVIERKNKTIAWCPSCATVLASAEIEYHDRKDPSLYVLFEMDTNDAKKLFPTIDKPIYFAIWTTTPWTLPLNRAILIKSNTQYDLLEVNGTYVIAGASRSEALAHLLKTEKKVVATISAEKLAQTHAYHPFVDNLTVPVIADESVGLDEGTACVHCAPGCGPLDYEVGVKNNLEIYSPVDPWGKYSRDIAPHELQGMPVSDGQIWVIKKLVEKNKLLHKASITHSYPHCWRCKHGLIFRATRQWFFNLQHVKERALEAVDTTINFLPEQGRSFLRATLESRWEWCLSRQRSWGAPIPALLCMHCDYAFTSFEFIMNVAHNIQKQGIEYWENVPVQEIMPPTLTCPNCTSSDFKKETDILDVWFDSGISHFAVLNPAPLTLSLSRGQSFPADMYLEGIDQHRGWFQSSLLTALVIEKQAPMKTIMTHGFTVDEKGQKMSKSLGNVIAPDDIIKKLGTDGLRLWVASIGHDGDAVVSETLLKNVSEVYRKIRNTCRVLLMNLYDYDHTQNAVPLEKLHPVDQYALHILNQLHTTIIQDYKQGNFTAIFHALADYCTTHVSALYVEVTKDRLYCDAADSHERRSVQTAMWYMLDTMTRLTAPILSFTAELISDQYQKNKQQSIHLQKFSEQVPVSQQDSILWDMLLEIRSAVLKAIEPYRAEGVIKQSLEAQVTVYLDPALKNYAVLEKFLDSLKKQGYSLANFLEDLFVVSQVTVTSSRNSLAESSLKGLYLRVEHAAGTKCPRCWKWSTKVDSQGLEPRCAQIVNKK